MGLLSWFGGGGNDKFDRSHASLWDKFKHDLGGATSTFNPLNWWSWLGNNWIWIAVAGVGALILIVLIFFLTK